MGGSDDPENLERLTVEEHAEAHKLLYEQHGHWQDNLAWKGLAGSITKKEILKELFKEAGKMGGDIGNKKRWAQPGEREKFGKIMSGANNPCARNYEITYPDGTKEKIKSLKTWCQDRGFNYNTFHRSVLRNGVTHGGYKGKRI